MNDVCICIPSQRKPPLRTFEFDFGGIPTFLISDPDMVDEHREFYKDAPVTILRGVKGMGPQSAECYRVARREGFKWYFRIDDDVWPGIFIHKDGRKPNLPEVVATTRSGVDHLPGISLIGFQNTSNRYFMKDKYTRSFSLVTGGANLVEADAPINLDELCSLARGEDTYKTCAHKEISPDNRIGKVGFIGLSNFKFVYDGTSIKITQEQLDHSIEFLKKRFPNQVWYTGEKHQKSDGLIFEKKRWVR